MNIRINWIKQIIVFCLIGIQTYAQNSSDEILSREFYFKKAKKYLLKDSLNHYNQLEFKLEGVFFFKDSVNKQENNFDYFISWKDLKNLKKDIENQPYDSVYNAFIRNKKYVSLGKNNIDKSISKKRIKIAISPGHLATNFMEAKYEEKYIEFDSGKIKFYESDLALRTALILKDKLLKEGFDVFLTRSDKKPDIWNLGFDKWKKERFELTLKEQLELNDNQAEWFKNEATDQQIFKYLYAKFELRKRAEMINKFDPDLTIAIHYNVDEKNKDWKKSTNKNFMMTFVPGSFLKNELKKPIDQLNFLKLLATDNIKKSIQLSKEFISFFRKMSCIPIATVNDADYLSKFCVVTEEKGVFSRNLAMTRLVNSPILYGEPLYQDNKKFSRSLNLHNPDRKNKKRTSKYLKKAADSYYKSVLSYLRK